MKRHHEYVWCATAHRYVIKPEAPKPAPKKPAAKKPKAKK